jgi:hypothetical protein
MSDPNVYSEEDIQLLIDAAELDPCHFHSGGPSLSQEVIFYTDLENDNVKSLFNYEGRQYKDIAHKAFEVVLAGLS